MFTVERKAADICGLTLRQTKITSRLSLPWYMVVQSYMSCCHGQAEEFCLPPLCSAVISPPESNKTRRNVNPQISATFYSTVCSPHYMYACCFCWSADAERPICWSCPVPHLPRSLHDGKPTSRNVNFKLERYASCSHRTGQASTHITIKHTELTVIYLACLDVWSLLLSMFWVLFSPA